MIAACAGVDVVFHNVAHNPLAKDDELFWSVNRDGTANLLRACLAERVRKAIYTSSSAVYGAPNKIPVTEATPPSPMVYGEAKLAGEKACLEYAAKGLGRINRQASDYSGSRTLGYFPDPVRMDLPGQQHTRSGRREKSVSIFARRRSSRYLYSRQPEKRPGRIQLRDGPVRHDARSAGASLPIRGHWVEDTVAADGANGMGNEHLLTIRISPLAPYHAIMYGKSMCFDTQRRVRSSDGSHAIQTTKCSRIATAGTWRTGS